jgi:hypothetical protein
MNSISITSATFTLILPACRKPIRHGNTLFCDKPSRLLPDEPEMVYHEPATAAPPNPLTRSLYQKRFKLEEHLQPALVNGRQPYYGNDIQDPAGLRKMVRSHYTRKARQRFLDYHCIQNMHRVPAISPLGSVFHRETEYFRQLTILRVTNPRHRFLTDMTKQIQLLQDKGHTIMVMMDANATLDNDKGLQAMLSNCSLTDLHRLEPAPSTFIGSAGR